jgi:hypothetical protein
MTTDGSSPHQLALDLAGMMYVGPARGRGLGDLSAGQAAARVVQRRPLAQPADEPRATPAAAPSEPTSTSAPPNVDATAPTAIKPAATDQAAPAPPPAEPTRRATSLRPIEPDTADACAGLDDEELLGGEGDAASPHEVMAAAAPIAETPADPRGLTLGRQRRRWSRAAKALAPESVEAVDAPGVDELVDEPQRLEDDGEDYAAAPVPVDAPVVDDAPEPSDISAPEIISDTPTIGSWRASRQRQRLRRQAAGAPSTRRRALLRGAVAGALVVAIAVVAAVALGGGLKPAGSDPAAGPVAAAPAPAPRPATVESPAPVTARAADARQAAAAKARRQAAAKTTLERRRREARERRQARERAQRRARARERRRAASTAPATAAHASSPAPAARPAPAPAPAPAAVAVAPSSPSSSSANRAGWTGEFTP